MRLSVDEDSLVVEVRNDGSAAPTLTPAPAHGPRPRVGAQGGALSVSGPPGDGTTVRAVIPLNGAARPAAIA